MNDWVYLTKFIDPPDATEGFITEVKRDSFFGIVFAYRFIPLKKESINE